eukprot:jgi/Psemu1/38084/gm1.38084_g
MVNPFVDCLSLSSSSTFNHILWLESINYRFSRSHPILALGLLLIPSVMSDTHMIICFIQANIIFADITPIC